MIVKDRLKSFMQDKVRLKNLELSDENIEEVKRLKLKIQELELALDVLDYNELLMIELKYMSGRRWIYVSDVMKYSVRACKGKSYKALEKLGKVLQ